MLIPLSRCERVHQSAPRARQGRPHGAARQSGLGSDLVVRQSCIPQQQHFAVAGRELLQRGPHTRPLRDRKSTRLNSSHGYISYAVFCLKKKKKKKTKSYTTTEHN